MATPTLAEREAYIRAAAIARGMDPDKVMRVARTEGHADGVWQSRVKKNGIQEPSFGDFQMLVGGDGTGFPEGLGNKFKNDTGLDPSDPSNYKAMTDYALDTASKEGWRQWYGPKNAGLDRWYGVKGSKPKGLTINSEPWVDPRLPMIDGPGDNTWNDMAHANMDAMPPISRDAGVDPANPAMVSADPAQVPGTTINSTPTLGDRLGKSLFGDKLAGTLKSLSTPAVPATATTPAVPGGALTQGLGLLAGIMQPKQAPQQSAPIQSTLPASEAEDAERAKGAATLMAALMANKKRPTGANPYGMSINSVPGMF